MIYGGEVRDGVENLRNCDIINYMKEQKYNLKLTKNQMGVICRALEALERAQMGQFKIALEQIFEFESDKEYRKHLKDVSWDEYNALEQMLKSFIFNRDSGTQQNNSYFGIAGTSESAKIAYEINKVLGQFLAVEQNDGYWQPVYRSYDDPLHLSQEPIAEVAEFQKYKDFPIPKKHWSELRKLFADGDLASMWNIVDSYIPKDIRASKTEIYPFSDNLRDHELGYNFADVCIRMWKPEKREEFEGNSHD
jgi:hypothetical protein